MKGVFSVASTMTPARRTDDLGERPQQEDSVLRHEGIGW
jgi:hypothetical protein